MLLVLFEQVECFQFNARLVGIMQQNQFDMEVENFDEIPIKCQAFNNTLSKAYLNYEEAGTIKNISTNFQYFADRPLKIQFTEIDGAIFDFMTKQSIITYLVQLEAKLDVPGYFSSIENTLVNTSNCWGPMTLFYSRSGNTSLLNLTAEPNDCLITNPNVTFQYLVNSTWETIQILPKASPPSGYDGYKTPFVHMETVFYEQAYKDMDRTNKAKLDEFFKTYSQNRQVQMRLSIEFTQAGSTLVQQIFSYVQTKQSSNKDCLQAINPFIAVSSTFLTIVGDQKKLKTCISDHEGIKINSSVLFNDKTYYFNSTLMALSAMSGFPFSFQENQAKLLNLLELPKVMVFLIISGQDGKIIREESYEYDVVGSCFSKIKYLISYEETCLVLFPVYNERCTNLYENGTITSFLQVLQENTSSSSRVSFQVYQFKLFLSSKPFEKICLNQKHTVLTSDYIMANGDYNCRQNEYVKKMTKWYQPLCLFKSNIEQQYEYASALDEPSVILTPLIITFIGLSIIVIIYISIATVKALQ